MKVAMAAGSTSRGGRRKALRATDCSEARALPCK